MPRKTVNIIDVLDYVNNILANDVHYDSGIREGATIVMDHILHSTGNYNGFRYLTNNELPANVRPGVRYDGSELLPYPERFEDTDPTRRQYSAKCDTYARWVERNKELSERG